MKFSRLLGLASMVVVGGVLLTTGCSATAKRKWLTFFFDGVPSETAATNRRVAPVSTNRSQVAAAPKPTAPVRPKRPEKIVHRPVLEGKCIGCHGNFTIYPNPEGPLRPLCFTCHKDFLAKMKVIHQTPGNGDCAACDEPHESFNKNL